MEVESNQSNRVSGYFVWIMTIMGFVHIIDVFVSNVGSLTTAAVATTFFPELTLTEAVAKMTIISMLTIVVMIFQPIIKVMTDKYGRKPMILATVLGMSVGNAIQGVSVYIYKVGGSLAGYITYIFGGAIAMYFLAADIQLLFIAEEAPKNKRGFWILFTIFLGNLGTLLVPVARGLLISDDYSRNDWYLLYLISAVLGVVLFVIMYFTMKESKAYTTAKELGELEIKSGNKFSFVNAVKDLRRSAVWKTYIWYLIAGALFMIPTMTFRSYTEPAFTDFGYSESEKNKILTIRIIFSVSWFVISGLLSDRLGRKIILVVDQTMFLVGVLAFLYLIQQPGHRIYLLGFSWGFMFAGTWGFMNLNVMATNEVVPTKLRASANGFGGIVSIIFMVIPLFLFSAILQATGNFAVPYYISLPFTVTLILIVIFRYKETKGAVLEDIKE